MKTAGLGTLTSRLLARAQRVVAVEFDGDLARKLPGQFPGKNLEVINEDILQFDLNRLPAGTELRSELLSRYRLRLYYHQDSDYRRRQ